MTLAVTDLRCSYGKHAVLKGVDFSAAEGECVCVLGANGAGKTTLFRCVLGLLGDYPGDICFDGANSRTYSAREIARKIAYVPQAHSPTFNYSVFETVLMGTNALTQGFRGPGASQRDVVEWALDVTGISHLASRGFAELSGGERQLVLIARALAQKSNMIIMDEPTANLDYGNQFRVLTQVRRLTRQGYLVVLSTHSPEHALLYADKVVVLRDGTVDMCGEPGAVLTPAAISDIYGISVELQQMRTAWGTVPVIVPKVE